LSDRDLTQEWTIYCRRDRSLQATQHVW